MVILKTNSSLEREIQIYFEVFLKLYGILFWPATPQYTTLRKKELFKAKFY